MRIGHGYDVHRFAKGRKLMLCGVEVDYELGLLGHSDADAALTAGYDVRHGLIGPGVYASHGYERSHKKGVENTFKLLKAYLA